MSNEVNIANLIRIAVDDLSGARLLASNNNRNAFYLLSQAAEKLIRSVLSSEGKHAGIKHDLKQMIDMIPAENPGIPLLRKVEHLTVFATAFRYTGFEGRIPKLPDFSTVETEARKIDAIVNLLVNHFVVNVSTKNEGAGNISPIRILPNSTTNN